MKKIISVGLLIIFTLSIIFTFSGCAEDLIKGIEAESEKGIEKLSAPWKNYEELLYVSTIDGTETNNSKIIISVEPIADKKYYKIERNLYIKDGTYISGALLNLTDLLPVSSYVEVKAKKDGKSQFTSIKGEYKEQLLINSNLDGKINTSKIQLPTQYFDNEYLSMAIREFSLKEGFTTEMKICSISANKVATLTLKVLGKEKVKVPYGEFECYKLAFYDLEKSSNDPLIFWISNDEKRNLIKYGQKDKSIELKSIKY